MLIIYLIIFLIYLFKQILYFDLFLLIINLQFAYFLIYKYCNILFILNSSANSNLLLQAFKDYILIFKFLNLLFSLLQLLLIFLNY